MADQRPHEGRTLRAIVFGVCLLLVAPGMAAASAAGSIAPAVTFAASALIPAGSAVPDALPVGSPRPDGTPVQTLPFLTLDPGALRVAKLRAAAAASLGQRKPLHDSALPLAGLFNGLNASGLSDYAVTPPDSTGGIGPSNYLEAVNQKIGVYDRNLTLLSSTDMGTFTGASILMTVSDPQIQWDSRANRWIYAAIGVQQGANSLLFGWSKGADPSDLTNGWCRFGIGRASHLDDYPKLGHDDTYILVGSNVYSDTSPSYPFETATVWAIPKPAPGDASCTTPSNAWYFADAAQPLHNADGSDAFTPVPANTADTSSAGYVVAAHSPLSAPLGAQDKLMLWHVISSAGTPNLVPDGDVSVPSFDVPAPAPQPGSTFTLDTLDARLTQAVAVTDPAAGALGIWTQHTVAGPGGRSVVRWYELIPGSAPTLRQHGEVSSSTDFIFNAAISPAMDGVSAAIFYNRAGSAQLPVIGALSRGPSTPLGMLEGSELLLGSSSTVDQDSSCSSSTPCRWGDYAGASPDPINANVVWGSSQVTGNCFVLCGWFSQWQTRNFAILTPQASITPTPIAVFRPSDGVWYINGVGSTQWGTSGDIPVPGDYNGDGITDIAVFRPADGVWYINGVGSTQWGTSGDIPVPGDYNGDGITDIAVFRPADGVWYINGVGSTQWGTSGDIPVPGDYNGDGITDIAVFRPADGVWYINGVGSTQWGTSGDIPVPGDYNGDGITDIAVFRPADGVWYINGVGSTQWGTSGDIPVPGDYNGDGITDIAVFRPADGVWYINGVGSTQWGTSGDIPTGVPPAIWLSFF